MIIKDERGIFMWTDNASKVDMLFYKPYASIVSETAISMDEEPLTVGVFGLWGAGKSTLLNLISTRKRMVLFVFL